MRRVPQVAHGRIKAVDPSVIVIAGALTPTGVNDPKVAVDDTLFIAQLEEYQGGAFRRYADAVGAHLAGYNNPPQDGVDSHSFLAPCYGASGTPLSTTNCFKNNGQFCFRRIDQLHQMIRQSRPWVGGIMVCNLNWRTFADFHADESARFGRSGASWCIAAGPTQAIRWPIRSGSR
jgi:hypothetical protein